MKSEFLNNVHAQYSAVYGKNNKKYYVLSKYFWDFINKQLQENTFKNKRHLAKFIHKITEGNISIRAIDGWFYNNRKPFIIANFELPKPSSRGCKHGFLYFCCLCDLNKIKMDNCPVPLFWVSCPRGKLYIYEKYWKDLKRQIDNHYKFGLLLSNFYGKVNIDDRTIRNWRNNKGLPKIFTKDEFSFSKHNLYFLGLFLSDGHIRNNGSAQSFTYQSGSSDVFQGYWHTQFIQRFLPIFQNKNRISNTYVEVDKTYAKSFFKSNLSSISPIFIRKLIQYNLIEKRGKTPTTGFKKNITQKFLEAISSYKEYFQGVFDGDGSYGYYTSPSLYLATSLDVSYEKFIDFLPLVPTATSHDKKVLIPYSKRNGNSVYFIRFAPESLRHTPKRYTALDIVKQLDFMIDSAHNSIRPDKVHKLIKIVRAVTSKNYGEYRSCLQIQKEIRDIAIKARLADKIEPLENRYPIKNDRYQPFMPKWAEVLCSKSEAWDFFLNKENLIFKVEHKLKDIDFSEGIPVNLEL